MKREVYSFISGLLLFSCLAISCDDGKIYDENNQTEREGGTVKLTAQINGIDSWPGGYSVVLAGFTPDNAFAQTAKGISQTADGTINMPVFPVKSHRSKFVSSTNYAKGLPVSIPPTTRNRRIPYGWMPESWMPACSTVSKPKFSIVPVRLAMEEVRNLLPDCTSRKAKVTKP